MEPSSLATKQVVGEWTGFLKLQLTDLLCGYLSGGPTTYIPPLPVQGNNRCK